MFSRIVRPIAVAALILSMALAGLWVVYLKRLSWPNIILVTVDSLRPDHLGCYGYKRNTSLNIDRLAGEGVAFTQAIAQAPYTLRSVPSFITSTYSYMNLIDRDNFIAYLNPESEPLPRILGKIGYTTAFFNDHPSRLGSILGLKEHFDVSIETETNNPEKLTKLVLRWLKGSRSKRFFLWLYYFGTHGPYIPSSPYSDEFLEDDLPKIDKRIPIASDDEKESFGVIPRHIAEGDINDADYYIARYDGKIRIVDEQIGLLLQELRSLGLDKNTLIILMSDHGESMGEHNRYFGHGTSLYDELLKVPLIMKYPRYLPKNRIVRCQVQLIDVAPTILEILNIDKRRLNNIEGISLVPYILKDKCDTDRYAFSNTDLFFSIRTADSKLIWINREAIASKPKLSQKFGGQYLNEYELYNLKADPYETKNLINEEKEKFEGLKQALNEYIIQAKKARALLRQQIEEEARPEAAEPLDERTKEVLRSIGYAQ